MPKLKNENSRYRIQMDQAERSMIEFTLEYTQTLAAAAEMLQVSRGFLSQRCKKLGIVLPSAAQGQKKGRPRKVEPESSPNSAPPPFKVEDASVNASNAIRGVPYVDEDELGENPEEFYPPGNGTALHIPPFSPPDDEEPEDDDAEADV